MYVDYSRLHPSDTMRVINGPSTGTILGNFTGDLYVGGSSKTFTAPCWTLRAFVRPFLLAAARPPRFVCLTFLSVAVTSAVGVNTMTVKLALNLVAVSPAASQGGFFGGFIFFPDFLMQLSTRSAGWRFVGVSSHATRSRQP